MENQNVLERIVIVLNEIAHSLTIIAENHVKSSSIADGAVGVNYADYLRSWVDKSKAPKAKHNYLNSIESYLKNYIIPAFGMVDIGSITSKRLQDFLLAIESDSTRTKVAAILSESLRTAYNNRVISFNPFLAVDFKKYTEPHLGALTHEQYLFLLDFVADRERMKRLYDKDKVIFTHFLLLTGMRQGEAVSLTRKDFDLVGKTVIVSKSRERRTNNIVTPKTKAGNRIVPIDDYLIDMLKPYFRKAKGEFIFPYKPDYASKWFTKVFKLAGLPGSGHWLRHTFITNAYELSIPPYAVMKWAGHHDIKQADNYLALRRAEDFIQSDITDYMLKLKKRVVPDFSNISDNSAFHSRAFSP